MNSFKCPECGSNKIGSNICVSTDWSVTGEVTTPWSFVLQQICCGNCDTYIPAHIGERWNDITYEEAKTDWIKIYKK